MPRNVYRDRETSFRITFPRRLAIPSFRMRFGSLSATVPLKSIVVKFLARPFGSAPLPFRLSFPQIAVETCVPAALRWTGLFIAAGKFGNTGTVRRVTLCGFIRETV